MIKYGLAGLFEAKVDMRKLTGIKESFNFSYRDNIQKVEAVFGIDTDGKIVTPYYFDKACGLQPLSSIIRQETFNEDVAKFVRSNRAVYTSFKELYLICTVKGKIDKTTGQWLDDENNKLIVNFYVPVAVNPLRSYSNNFTTFDSDDLYILGKFISSSMSKNSQLHFMKPNLINMYKNCVLMQLSNMVTEDKTKYYGSRILN